MQSNLRARMESTTPPPPEFGHFWHLSLRQEEKGWEKNQRIIGREDEIGRRSETVLKEGIGTLRSSKEVASMGRVIKAGVKGVKKE